MPLATFLIGLFGGLVSGLLLANRSWPTVLGSLRGYAITTANMPPTQPIWPQPTDAKPPLAAFPVLPAECL
jgi:hypothetical protein